METERSCSVCVCMCCGKFWCSEIITHSGRPNATRCYGTLYKNPGGRVGSYHRGGFLTNEPLSTSSPRAYTVDNAICARHSTTHVQSICCRRRHITSIYRILDFFFFLAFYESSSRHRNNPE